MPNIRILAEAVLQIFCSQGCSYIVEKGALLQNDKTGRGKKNTGPLIFHVHATYIISRFKHKQFLSFSAAKKCYGQTDGQAQTNMPPSFLRSWGHKKYYNIQKIEIPIIIII